MVPNKNWGTGLLCFWTPNRIWGFSTASFWDETADDKVRGGVGHRVAILLLSLIFSTLLLPIQGGRASSVTSMSPVLHSLGLWKHKSLSLLTKPDSCKWMHGFLVCFFRNRFAKINLALWWYLVLGLTHPPPGNNECPWFMEWRAQGQTEALKAPWEWWIYASY